PGPEPQLPQRGLSGWTAGVDGVRVRGTRRSLPMRNRLVLSLFVAALVASLPGSALASGPGPAGTEPPLTGASAPPPSPATKALQVVANRTFRFYGSGWGHGVGMSQYG